MCNNTKTALIGLGSNLGFENMDKTEVIEAAIEDISQFAYLKKSSCLYVSPAWPEGNDSPDYLNCVIAIETGLKPREILEKLRNIESKYGRVRDKKNRWAARTIDLDIIAIDDLVVNEKDLKIPHPRMEIRDFVILPLSEVAPRWVHPVTGASLVEMIAALIFSGKHILAKPVVNA
jgi:2-amino-4-hydroxy-6-hydroxymethyldihydropteridine diphosphokinase